MRRPPRGPAPAIATNAGGPGVMAVDDLMTRGGQLAPPTIRGAYRVKKARQEGGLARIPEALRRRAERGIPRNRARS